MLAKNSLESILYKHDSFNLTCQMRGFYVDSSRHRLKAFPLFLLLRNSYKSFYFFYRILYFCITLLQFLVLIVAENLKYSTFRRWHNQTKIYNIYTSVAF